MKPKQHALDFPDTGRRDPDRTVRETVKAMRAANGDRAAAAAALGVTATTLASRLSKIRELQRTVRG